MKKGQKQPSSYSCTELSKTQFVPMSIVNNITAISSTLQKQKFILLKEGKTNNMT